MYMAVHPRRKCLCRFSPSRWNADTWRHGARNCTGEHGAENYQQDHHPGFHQSEPVSDVVKAATYRLFFVSDDNERISNENSCIADSRDQNASKNIFP